MVKRQFFACPVCGELQDAVELASERKQYRGQEFEAQRLVIKCEACPSIFEIETYKMPEEE